MVLRRSIFLRISTLTVLLIMIIAVSYLVFDIAQHRVAILELTKTKIIVLAPQVEELVIEDEPMVLKNLADSIVQANPEIDYILIEKDAVPYVHTFTASVPDLLLARQGITDSPSVWDYV
ncbi:MAG: hypothetical protein ACYTFE_05115, partial [Planctomycetota bacterium]